ncbi:MAG: N-acetylmuramoyl-L-alanine amidase [Raineya sp.]|nr:N-acetylmuramoyl-L-alanine amidase [Raineya sp.]
MSVNKKNVQNFLFLAIIVLICFAFTLPFKSQSPSPQKYKIRTVVIDAGHGGHDPGALGKNTKEKDITLAVSLELGATIKKYLPDVNVIYTRTTDTFVELYKRAEIANRNDADVFISIHCNSMDVKKNKKSAEAKGLEVFVMGPHVSKENLEVARRENAVVALESGYKKNYGGFDPNSPQAAILSVTKQNNYLENSLRLSTLIDKQFNDRLNRKTRGIKQAGFLVLREIASTSILVELGYLSNEEEESYLKDPWSQTLMASAIYRAFRDFKNEVEK